MKTIVIGDLHGRGVWENIPDLLSYGQVIFLGDYFDSKEGIAEDDQISNFLKVLHLKKEHPEKFILLLGNHDFHYFPFTNSRYSGFSETLYPFVSEIFDTANQNGLLEVIFHFNHFLISHAGVTKTWFGEKIGNHEVFSLQQIAAAISSEWTNSPESFDFDSRKGASPDGNDPFQSPFSVRPASVLCDSIPNCIQIVGHTQTDKIEMINNKLILCDTLGQRQEILLIKDSKISVVEF